MNVSSTIYHLIASSSLLICISCSAQSTKLTPMSSNDNNAQTEQLNQKIAYNIGTGEVQPDNLQPKDKIINLKTGEPTVLSPNLTDKLVKNLDKTSDTSNMDSNYPKFGASLINALTHDSEDNLSVIITPIKDLNSEQSTYLFSLFNAVDKQTIADKEVWYAQASPDTLKKLANSPLISQVTLQPSVSIPSLPPSNIDKENQVSTSNDTSLNQQLSSQSKMAQSLDLLQKLSEQSPNDNIAFSTFSLDQAAKAALLAMPNPLTAKRPNWLLAGLTTQTMSQPTVPLTDGYQNLNQVFYRQGDTLTKPYQAAYTATLAGNTQALGFGEADAASTQANEWLKTSTNGMIDDMFTPDMFSKNEAILSNVLYFKANWQSPFSTEKTKPLPFTSITGKTQTVPTMNQEFKVYHAKDKGWEYVGIPFADGSMLQLFVTPKDKASALPDSDTVTALLQTSKEQKVQLLLPKLTLEGDTLTLNEIAPEIGSWQLPHLVEGKVLKNPKMVHKSVVTWDEQGAEAAAASTVMVSKGISVTPTVAVDRPFMFMIRQGDEVMFTGAVRDMDAVAVKSTS